MVTNTGDTDATDDLTTSSTATGDVTGTFASTFLSNLQGNPINAGTPGTGEVLKWNGTQWVPSADDNEILTQGTGIDITGGVVTNTGDTDATDDLTTSSTATGDITGAFASTFLSNLQGNPVNATTPSTGEVLKWNGTQWVTATDDTQGLTAGTGITLIGSSITNTGDINGTDDVLLTDSPTGGAISGSFSGGLSINNNAVVTGTIQDGAVTDDKIADVGLPKIQQGGATDGDLLNWNNTSGNWEPFTLTAADENQALADVLSNGADAGNVSITNVSDLVLNGGTITVSTEAGKQADLQTLTGLTAGSTDLGNLSHPVLTDNQTIVDAIVQLGDEVNDIQTNAFSTTNQVPVGDGSGLVTSGIFKNGTNIGIGIASASEQLEVLGNVEIPAANEYQFATAKTKYISYHPTVFSYVGAQDAQWRTFNAVNLYAYFEGTSGTSQLTAVASVHLPDGAVVTNVEAWLYDDETAAATSLARVRLSRHEVGVSTSSVTMATVETTQPEAATTLVTRNDNTISSATIDNSTYAYRLIFQGIATANIQLHGVRITYTVSKVD